MPILPSLRPFVTKNIGAFLNDSKKIKDLVLEATGEDPHVIWTNDRLPFGRQISDILDALENEKTERWLLTYVLIVALENEEKFDKLRDLIVTACPETLITTPKVEPQVKRLLTDLQQLLPQPLPADVRDELRLKQPELQTMVQDTARLFAYKCLHESLHGLHLKLTFGQVLGAALGEDTEAHVAVSNALAWAAQATPLLGFGSDDEEVELEWIAALEPLATELEAAASAGNRPLEHDLIDEVRSLIQLHLIRLNGCVFGAARNLSLSSIVQDPPIHFNLRPEFIDLKFAVHDLKPSLLARALKHRLWQDAEKELPLIDALLDVPGPITAETIRQWFRFKSRILWLAELDPNAGWNGEARTLADQISDAMANNEEWSSIKELRENYHKFIAFCFFAIDAMLKRDCTVLRKVDRLLSSILQELSDE